MAEFPTAFLCVASLRIYRAWGAAGPAGLTQLFSEPLSGLAVVCCHARQEVYFLSLKQRHQKT